MARIKVKMNSNGPLTGRPACLQPFSPSARHVHSTRAGVYRALVVTHVQLETAGKTGRRHSSFIPTFPPSLVKKALKDCNHCRLSDAKRNRTCGKGLHWNFLSNYKFVISLESQLCKNLVSQLLKQFILRLRTWKVYFPLIYFFKVYFGAHLHFLNITVEVGGLFEERKPLINILLFSFRNRWAKHKLLGRKFVRCEF